MAYRTWGRLLLTALGVSVLAGAGQLGVAYGFGIVRLTGAFTGSTVNQWPAQLVWVGWFAANAAVAGAVLTGRLARRDTPPASTGRHLAIGGAAALGATAVAPLCMQPARAAELISVDPVWAVGICAILGAVIGAGAAIAVLLRPELGWNMAAVAGTIWLLALVSVLPSLGTAGPLPTVRLGVLEPDWLNDAAAQRLALLVLPLVALLAGAATAGLARWRGQIPLISAATGVAGPVLVAFAYLTAGPGDAVDRYQTTPYYGALIAVLAGALGAAAAALLRWPVGVRAAESEAIAPTDILRPLPTGPTLPGTEPATSTDQAEDHPGPAGGQLVGTAAGPRAGDDTTGVRTVPAHWDWPSATASGQHGPVPADATRPGESPRPTGPRQRSDAAGSAADAPTPDPSATGGRYDRTPARASWLTDPTGEFTAGRQSSSRAEDATGGAADPARTAAASSTPATAAVSPTSTTPASAAVSPTSDAGGDGATDSATTGWDKPATDRTTISATEAPPDMEAPLDTDGSGDTGTPLAGTTVAPVTQRAGTRARGGAGTPSAGDTGEPVAANSGTPSTQGTNPQVVDVAGTPSTGPQVVANTGTPSIGPQVVANAGTPSTGPQVVDVAGTPSTESGDSAGDRAVDASTPKPRRSRKPKSVPAATSTTATDDGTAAATGTNTSATATAGPATAGTSSAGTSTAGTSTEGTTGGRAKRTARAGKGTDVTSVDQPLGHDASRPSGESESATPDEATRTAEAETDARAAEGSADLPAGGSTPVPESRAGRRTEPEGGTGASLFGEPTAGDAGADRWTPAAPAWSATPSWTTASTDPEPSAADAPASAEESTDWTPRFRHRAPLPDLSRVPTWDAFDTTRRARSSDQSTGTPDQNTSAPPAGTAGPAVSTPDPAPGTTGRADQASAMAALARSIVPPSIPPVVPEQGGPSTTAGSAEPANDPARTSTDDGRSSRRGRLGGLFRRNRVRADEESRPAPDAAEPLPSQDEEFVDWVAGLSKPVTDNEPEQESGRRSLRSTGRHHRD
ncbi:hypothetical protein [Micromonospora sp. CA-246542]|uniref:hypothetical protein n=1 Tax=Micromonospora sp. CA-246542 TaxID=3239959 RepID=UPI003D8B0648